MNSFFSDDGGLDLSRQCSMQQPTHQHTFYWASNLPGMDLRPFCAESMSKKVDAVGMILLYFYILVINHFFYPIILLKSNIAKLSSSWPLQLQLN